MTPGCQDAMRRFAGELRTSTAQIRRIEVRSKALILGHNGVFSAIPVYYEIDGWHEHCYSLLLV